MSRPILEAEDLHVWFDLGHDGELHPVQGVSFDLGESERMGLVGESGCGKTTTILALMGLLPPNASVHGKVLLDGEDIMAKGEESVSPHRWHDVAMVFQGAMNAFNPVKTVGQQIVEPMELHGVASGRAAKRGCASCSRWSASPATAPTGTRTSSRAACASGRRSRWRSSCEPQVLLADEPTTALDVMVQAQILELLTSLSNDLGLAMILVTHDLPVVAQVCRRAAVMYAGEIVEAGPI